MKQVRIKQTALVYLTLLFLATASLCYKLSQSLFSKSTLTQTPDVENLAPLHISSDNLLYLVLIAELAQSRDMPKVALDHYLAANQISQDPKLAQKATQLAIELQEPEKALISAKLWADKTQDSEEAQLITATLLIGNQPEQAIPYLTRALEIHSTELQTQLGAIQMRLSEKSAFNLKKILEKIALTHPHNPLAFLLAAQSAALQEDIENADEWTNAALRIQPDFTPALELKARLIRFNSENSVKALEFLNQQVAHFPNNEDLRLFYANALLDADELEKAKPHLQLLINDKSHGGTALILMSEIYLKTNHLDQAFETLQKATQFKSVSDVAHFFLGSIAEQQGNLQEAIHQYTQTTSGLYYLESIARAVNLLAINGEYAQATELLQHARPNSEEEEKQLILMEVNLLMASDQYDAAAQLSHELLKKLPSDVEVLSAYLDSMGWYYYHSGKLSEAATYLNKANKLSDNAEIAAHFGEVLWMIGDKEKAKSILFGALEKNPDNLELNDALKRLNIPLARLKVVQH